MTFTNSTAFTTWYDKYTKLDPAFERSKNDDMESILQFFSEPTDDPLTHFSVALCDEPGLVLGIDSSRSQVILVHNVEVRPATRQNPAPVIRALYGLGREATPVLIDKSVFETPIDVESPSVTVIRKATKDGIFDIQTMKTTSSLEGIGLVLLPPFIAKVLLDLPSLACDKVLAAVLEAIGTYDTAAKNAMADPVPTGDPTVDLTDPSPTDSTGELPEDPIEDPDFVLLTDPPLGPYDAPTQDSSSSPKAGKQKSVYSRCAFLIKYLFMAQFQQKHSDQIPTDVIPVVKILPTMELSHKEWSVIRHIQASVNQPGGKAQDPTTSATDPTRLFETVANPLNDIKACLEELADKVGADAPSSSKTSLQKLEAKFESPLIDMFLRLSSVDGKSPALQPEEFLVKFLTAKGTGGTGAAELVRLHNKRLRRNINIPIGCITAMHHGRFLWDHPTIPNNFSPFYTPRQTVLDMGRAATNELMNVQIRALIGKGIENSDITKITKQFMTVPSTVPDLIRQLENHNALQSDFWGKTSMIHLECAKFIKGIDEYDAVYESAHVHDTHFLAKVMYYYDLTLYRLYEECLVKEDFTDIRWELSDLQSAHTKVLCGQFFQNLPPTLLPPAPTHQHDPVEGKRKRPPTTGSTSDVPGRDVRQRPPKGTEFTNQKQPHELKLHPSEPFHEVILRSQQLKLVPVWPGSRHGVCLNWHINGRCHDNCDRQTSHTELPTETLKGMVAFVKACRHAHIKSSFKGNKL
jgi:hypothetical protein